MEKKGVPELWHILILLLVFSLPLSISRAEEYNKREWKAAGSRIIEIESKVIQVFYGKKRVTFQFDLDIYDLYPNSSKPICLVVTYNRAEVKEVEQAQKAKMSPKFMTCKTFIIDMPTGAKHAYEASCSAAITHIWSPDGDYALNGLGYYIVQTEDLISKLQGADVPKTNILGTDLGCGGVVDADSWAWVSNTVLRFSGGACGTFLDFLFDAGEKKLETYCSRYQKPGYGCPKHGFEPASEFEKRIRQLQESADRDNDAGR